MLQAYITKLLSNYQRSPTTRCLSDSFLAFANFMTYQACANDCIDLFIKTNYSPVNVYLILSDESNGKNVDVNNPNTYKDKILLRDMSSAQKLLQRVAEDYKTMTGNLYFILEKNTSNEDVSLLFASWYDYRDKINRDIKDTLVENIYTRKVNGITKYYYWYQATPVYESSTPIDNSMDFEIAFTTEKPPVNPNPPSKPTASKVTVTQFERTSNTGYVETTNGKTVVSLANASKKFTYNGSKYTLNNTMPDSGVIYVDVYYSIPTVTNELTVAKKISASMLNSGIADEVNAKLANGEFGFNIKQNDIALGDKAYTLTNADSTQEAKTTDASGVFALKPDCLAMFIDIFNYNDTVVIAERVPGIFSFDTSYLLKDLVANQTLKQDSGATMFYVIGVIAVLGAAAAFVLYRKRSLVIGFAKQILRFR